MLTLCNAVTSELRSFLPSDMGDYNSEIPQYITGIFRNDIKCPFSSGIQVNAVANLHDLLTIWSNMKCVTVKVVLAAWKVKTPCHANGVFINKC